MDGIRMRARRRGEEGGGTETFFEDSPVPCPHGKCMVAANQAFTEAHHSPRLP